MAENLWSLGGKPTFYEKLPTGWMNYVNLGYGTYVITFEAKSLNGNFVRVTDTGPTSYSNNYYLTTEYKQYSAEFTYHESDRFYFYCDTPDDVSVRNIKLIRKPMPKLTVNGIDDFFSGKWTVHPNATVLDRDTLVLNSTATYQHTMIDVYDLDPGTYTFSLDINEGRFLIRTYSALDTILEDFAFQIGKTQTVTVKEHHYLRIFLTSSFASGTYMFKRPQLVKGSSVLPYSKCTGTFLVESQIVGKNLFDDEMETGIYAANSGSPGANAAYIRSKNFIKVSPKTYITFSRVRYVHFYDLGKRWIGASLMQDESSPVTVLNPEGCHFIKFHVTLVDPSEKFQIEVGTSPTAYMPHKVGVNKRSFRLNPTLNDVKFHGYTFSTTTAAYIASVNALNVSSDEDIVYEAEFKVPSFDPTYHTIWGAVLGNFNHAYVLGKASGMCFIPRNTGLNCCFGDGDSAYRNVTAPYYFVLDKWYVFRAVHSNKTGMLKVYIDGELVLDFYIGPVLHTEKALVGKWSASYATYPYYGHIRYVKITNGTKPLVHYDFTKPSDSKIIEDISGNGNKANVVGNLRIGERKSVRVKESKR